MVKKSKFKKLLSTALAGIITLSAITIPTLDVRANTSNIGAKNGDVVTLDTRGGDWLDWGINDKVYRSKVDYGTYTNPSGEEYQNAVYCIEPKKPGVSTRGSYDVTLEEFDDDRIRAIFVSGYPVNTPAELGLSSSEQAFYATKMAIDTYLTGLNIDDWKANTSAHDSQYSTQVVNAIKQIYKDGMAYDLSSLPNYEYVVTFIKSEELSKQTYSKIFKVEVNEDLKKNSASDVTISLSGDVPSGAKLLDMSGNERNTFAIGEEFQVVFTVPYGDYSNRSFDLNVVGGITNSTKLYKGVPNDSSVQTYAVYPQWNEHTARYPDADSKAGLMGARFILYNESGTPIGEFKSDNEGYVHIHRKLEDGKYYIEEVEAPKGYVVDNQRKTIYVQQGRTTSIVWENRLLAGQIQITKRSADYNDVTKLPAGSPLEGAVFEVYNTKNNVVDVITTDYRGVGASKGLPVGVYFVKEVQAPQYYALNDKEMWVKISHDGDIVKLDVLNKSLYLDVNVRKQGPTTINAGETLTYHITDIRNNSNTPLTNFIIHDQIPVGALRVEKIITGTFNERVNYSIKYKTNKSGEYKTLASNLLSKNSYEFSLHPNVLGLAKDEFITDVKMEFPRVSSGFASLTSTKLNMYVLPTTASGYEITNKATAGGYAGTTFEHAISTWKTVVQKSIPKNPLPKTGY